MRPQIALLIGTAGVLTLLVADRETRSKRSLAMWVPTFWIIIIASRMVTQWFATSSMTTTQSYVDGSPLDAGIFLLLTVLAFGIVVARRIAVADWIGRNLFLCLYLVYCGISITWSDFPIVSLKRYIRWVGRCSGRLTDKILLPRSRRSLTDARMCWFLFVAVSAIYPKSEEVTTGGRAVFRDRRDRQQEQSGRSLRRVRTGPLSPC
jgi:hypothetical protein